MKRLVLVSLVFAALFCRARADGEKFTAILSPDDLTAAGLTTLTPVQLERLNTLVENYKSGALAASRRAVDDALAAKQAAEAQAARAEAKVEVARAETAKAEAAKTEATKAAQTAGFLAKAKGLLGSGAKAEAVEVESTIPGNFRGWEHHQIFVLANGQRWQVDSAGSYYTRTFENPRVQIVPAAFTGYWLRFPDLDTQARATLIGEK